MLILFLTSFVSVLLVLSLYARYSYFGRNFAKIPGHRGWPLIGHALLVCRLGPEAAFKFISNSNKTYGRISKHTAGFIGIVHVTHPDYVEKLIGTHRYTAKLKPYTFFRSWLGEGLLTSNGDKWRHRRKLLTPAFHFVILKKYLDIFKDETERLLTKIQGAEDDCIDVTSLTSRTTLNVMCRTTTGLSVNEGLEALTTKYFDALHVYGKTLLERLMSAWYHVDLIYRLSPLGRREQKLVGDLHVLTKKIVQERKVTHCDHSPQNDKNNEKGRLAMLDILLENEKEGTIDIKGVREEVDTFLFAGHDTTAAALNFMIMRIANETKIQVKIYEEIFQIFGDSRRPPTVEDLTEMKFLECCIKESLRLYPGVPLFARYNLRDVSLGEYIVPKGAITFIHVYDMHHDPELFPDPERFDPERFRPELSAARHHYSYIPFSAGPRNCIGQKFAMMELKTVMSGILRRFHLDAVTKTEDVIFITDLVLRSRDPLYVRFRPRSNVTE